MPLSPKLRELSADELDLLQLVHNYGVVQAVLDRAGGSDLEVARRIAALIERGYLACSDAQSRPRCVRTQRRSWTTKPQTTSWRTRRKAIPNRCALRCLATA